MTTSRGYSVLQWARRNYARANIKLAQARIKPNVSDKEIANLKTELENWKYVKNIIRKDLTNAEG